MKVALESFHSKCIYPLRGRNPPLDHLPHSRACKEVLLGCSQEGVGGGSLPITQIACLLLPAPEAISLWLSHLIEQVGNGLCLYPTEVYVIWQFEGVTHHGSTWKGGVCPAANPPRGVCFVLISSMTPSRSQVADSLLPRGRTVDWKEPQFGGVNT